MRVRGLNEQDMDVIRVSCGGMIIIIIIICFLIYCELYNNMCVSLRARRPRGKL